jgi:hypothetical protein
MADTRRNTPITFIVPGQLQAAAQAGATRGGPSTGSAGDGLRIKASVRLGSTRATGEPVRVVAVPGEDVVVLHIAGGPALVLHPETARDLLLGQGTAMRALRRRRPSTRDGGSAGAAALARPGAGRAVAQRAASWATCCCQAWRCSRPAAGHAVAFSRQRRWWPRSTARSMPASTRCRAEPSHR